LVGFGLDSLIEVTSGAAVLRRMHLDDAERRERAERISLRIVGGCFIALAAYIAADATNHSQVERRTQEEPRASPTWNWIRLRLNSGWTAQALIASREKASDSLATGAAAAS